MRAHKKRWEEEEGLIGVGWEELMAESSGAVSSRVLLRRTSLLGKKGCRLCNKKEAVFAFFLPIRLLLVSARSQGLKKDSPCRNFIIKAVFMLFL